MIMIIIIIIIIIKYRGHHDQSTSSSFLSSMKSHTFPKEMSPMDLALCFFPFFKANSVANALPQACDTSLRSGRA